MGDKENDLTRDSTMALTDLLRKVTGGSSRSITWENYLTALYAKLDSEGYVKSSGSLLERTIATKTNSYTIVAATDDIILVDTSGGAFTITLPPAADAYDSGVSKIFSIKAITTDNNVTVEGYGAETIDGAANQVLTAASLTGISVASDGSNYHIIS